MEILTILDLTGETNPNGFPDSVGNDWTSASSGSYGLYLDTYYGKPIFCDDIPRLARCVRGSRCYPKSRFVALSDDLVRDTLTGLVWQRQGSPAALTWANAQSYCSSLGSGFRLPSYRELVSLLGLSSGPSTAFPGGMPGLFWTSSPYGGPSAESSGNAYYADFFSRTGSSCESTGMSWATVSTALNVRCVR